MSDDLNNKIKQVAELLGQDTIPDNIKGLLSLLSNPSNKEEPLQRPSETHAHKEERAQKSELEENVEMIRRVKKMMDKMNSGNDPRVNLLTAIKPYLNSKRQKKLNQCIKLIQMSGITKFMDEHDKGIF